MVKDRITQTCHTVAHGLMPKILEQFE